MCSLSDEQVGARWHATAVVGHAKVVHFGLSDRFDRSARKGKPAGGEGRPPGRAEETSRAQVSLLDSGVELLMTLSCIPSCDR